MGGHFKIGERCDFVRRTLLKAVPAALAGSVLSLSRAQVPGQVPEPKYSHPEVSPMPEVTHGDLGPPNAKQRAEFAKADYQSNLKDARKLIDLTKEFEINLEKSDANTLPADLLKKLDDIDKVTKRIRGRMRR